MKTTKLLTMAFAALVVCSCQTPMNINYFQDLQDGQSEAIQTVHEITVQPEDQLSIVVNSKESDPEHHPRNGQRLHRRPPGPD